MRLTVAIPTYNRNEYLKRNLPILLDQVTDECSVLILDNHSDEPVEDAIRDVVCRYPNANVEIVRHRTNIGGGANIIRCIELSRSEWVWMLGDDDSVQPDAIQTILKGIESQPNAVYINYCSPRFARKQPFVTRGLSEFIGQMDSYSNVLFMSVGIFNRQLTLPYLRFGHMYTYSWAPNFAILLASMGDAGTCYFATEQVVSEMTQVPAEMQWSQLSTLIGRSALLDLPMSSESRSVLARKLSEKPALEYIATVLTLTAAQQKNGPECLYLYDQICGRLYYFDRRLTRRLRIFGYRWLIRFPAAGMRILELAFKMLKNSSFVRNNDLSQVVVSDRFVRM